MTIIIQQPGSGMSYLALAQKLVEKCGISGVGPVTTIGQVGELKRVTGWINEAWSAIQQVRADWEWMRASVSFSTVAGQATYSASQCGAFDLAEWIMNTKDCTFRSYLASVGVASEISLSYMPYEGWRNTYQKGSMRIARARPMSITITPDQSIGLGMTPDSADYVIVGDYFREPSAMTADADSPAMPARFHMLIVYQAMQYYAQYEGDEYMRQTSEREYSKMMGRMTIAQLPEMTLGGALA